MNADGSDPTQLTTGSNDSEPQWSPDGTHIAFIRNDSGAFNLWVVSDSGDEPAQLTTAGASRFSWSPDGTKLAFSTDRNGNADIYTMNSDGSAEAIRAGDSADDDRPTWSPDGFEILFQSRRSGNDDLWIVGPLGNNPRNLTNSPHSERSAAFVPDGSKIIYQRGLNPAIQHNLGVFESDLYRMNADGSEQQQLTFEEGEDATPSVSSDGRRIAWTRNVGPTIDVYVANADGTKSVPLTTTGVDIAPVWQPCLRTYWRGYSTTTRSEEERPKVSGKYISSARVGGTTKRPGVVARATYVYSWTPSQRSEAKASTRSSRMFWCSYQVRVHHHQSSLPRAFGSCGENPKRGIGGDFLEFRLVA